jgi:hypothetical protein
MRKLTINGFELAGPTVTTTNDEVVSDSVVEAVRDDLLRRSKIGIKKYNTTLDRTDIDLKGWVSHALEEALDLSLYLKRIQIELNERSQTISTTKNTESN